MKSVRQDIGGLGNLLFKEAFLWGLFRGGFIPDIYVQSLVYWNDFREEIRTRFSHGVKSDDRIALHIRRGDYLKATQFHTNLWDTDYYKEAIKEFPGARFLVFCRDNQSEAQDKDDQEWLKANLPQLGIPFDLHEHTTEVEDLNAMASCKGIIMANSSFSWWAAFLGDPNKKVIAPREDRWFVDGKKRTDIPVEWKQL